MNIGEAARASGVSAKMIRHYEAIGLIAKPARGESGYRRFTQNDVDTLRFVHRAREAGFSIARIGQLLSLWRNPRRPAREVRRLAAAHLAEIEAQAERLRSIAAALSHLVHHCRGDDRPACPILDSLAGTKDRAP